MGVVFDEFSKGNLVTSLLQFRNELSRLGMARGLLEAFHDDRITHKIQVDCAPCRQEWESLLYLFLNASATSIDYRGKTFVESEFLAVLADQIDDRQMALSFCPSQTSPELLREESR